MFISREELGEPCSLLADNLPDWSFELEEGQWRSYMLEESVELDRYWRVFCRRQGTGGLEPHLAKVRVMRRDGVIDFRAMTCTVGRGRPRKLQVRVKESGWLSNRYFFEAFKAALGRAGVAVESPPEEIFDFRFNQDFRGLRDDGRELFRGGQRYELPIGWKRFAIHVKDRYDDGDNKWLKEDDSGWAVAYHGTAGESLPGILCAGFRVGDRQKFERSTGAGVYCTSLIGVAQHYSKPKKLEGHSVQIVLQLRIKPSAIKLITDPKATEFERKYWVINDPQDIRAYGVLIRELSLAEYVPPEAMVFGFEHPATKKLMAELRAEVEAAQ